MKAASRNLWVLTMRHPSKKTRVVEFPGGLSEAEARRNACIKLGSGWWVLYCNRSETAA